MKATQWTNSSNFGTKPYQLENNSSPAQFQEWKRRFLSFFLGSGLKNADVSLQQSYFRECLSPQLASLLDSQIDDTLAVYPDPEIPNDNSCMEVLQKAIEVRFPLTLRRLGLFTIKQNSLSFSDYVAKIKKRAETADIGNLSADNVLSYVLLSGCNDSIILEEVLKLSKNPDFDQIVKIGTNLEVSRSILKALPGTHSQNQNRSFKISNNRRPFFRTQYRSKSRQSYRKQGFPKNRVLKVTHPFLLDMQAKSICTKCGKFKCPNMNNCPSASKICNICKKKGT